MKSREVNIQFKKDTKFTKMQSISRYYFLMKKAHSSFEIRKQFYFNLRKIVEQ